MSLIRLGDRLDESSKEAHKPYFRAADTLAQRIFEAILSDQEIDEYYIQSPRRATSNPATPESQDKIFEGLGEYERTLVGKLLDPPQKILCVVGPLDSGKSTAVKFVMQKLAARYCDACPERENCNRRKLNLYVDFTRSSYQSNSEQEAKKVLYERVCTELRSKLKLRQIVGREEELLQFWDEEIKQLDSDPASTAFRAILVKLDDQFVYLKAGEPTQNAVAARAIVLDWVEQQPTMYLDYLVRLWGYVKRHYFANQSACAFVVFDNIDKASPTFQHTLVDIVLESAANPGPVFLLVLRTQTQARLGMNTGFLDVMPHVGPKPSQVILDRLDRFVSNPYSYYDAETGLLPAEFEMVRAFLLQAHRLIKPDDHKSRYLQFIDDACGQNVRAALLLAQNLLRVAESDMREARSSTFIRVSINQGTDQFRASPKSPLANLFHVNGEEQGRLLVKARILRFIDDSPEHTRSLGEMRHALAPFGYTEAGLIRNALNELMNIYCQLVYSEGFDAFTESEFQNASSQHINLTEAGRGYANSILYDLDYIQEVMLDSYLSVEHFGPKISTFYLADKFLLLAKFLEELRRDDVAESLRFTQTVGRGRYFETFGSLLLSLDIVSRVSDSVSRIIQSIRRSTSPAQTKLGQSDPYGEVLSQFESLLLQTEHNNHEILGIWHSHGGASE